MQCPACNAPLPETALMIDLFIIAYALVGVALAGLAVLWAWNSIAVVLHWSRIDYPVALLFAWFLRWMLRRGE